MELILAKRYDISPPCVDGSGVPAANKSRVAIRPVRSSSPKAGSSHIDNEKTVAEGQLLRVHNDSDSDDQVNTSLDMSTSSFAKIRREQGKKHTDEHNINLQTLNFLPIFKRKCLHPILEHGAPINKLVACTDSGSINDSDSFLLWMKHLNKYGKPTKESTSASYSWMDTVPSRRIWKPSIKLATMEL